MAEIIMANEPSKAMPKTKAVPSKRYRGDSSTNPYPPGSPAYVQEEADKAGIFRDAWEKNRKAGYANGKRP